MSRNCTQYNGIRIWCPVNGHVRSITFQTTDLIHFYGYRDWKGSTIQYFLQFVWRQCMSTCPSKTKAAADDIMIETLCCQTSLVLVFFKTREHSSSENWIEATISRYIYHMFGKIYFWIYSRTVNGMVIIKLVLERKCRHIYVVST